MALPNEIVYEIIREAWATITLAEEWGNRWDFFRSMSLVSRSWRGNMILVALRRVMIQSAREFAIYRILVKAMFSPTPLPEPQSADSTTRHPTSTGTTVTSSYPKPIHATSTDPHSKVLKDKDSNDKDSKGKSLRPCVHPHARDYFRRSDIYIVLTDWSCPGTTGFVYSTDYASIPYYIPTCKYIEVLVKELPSNDRYILPYRPLFEFLTQYDTTPEICLSWTYQHINRYILPDHHVHGVTYLRLHEYPRCVCHNHRLPPGRRHKDDCFSYLIPTLFPDLRHLHITTPYFLKNLSILPQVTLLEIEAPPIHYMANKGHYSSLSGWNIVSALSKGLLKPNDGDAMPKKIIVNSGPEMPYGWLGAEKACKDYGVHLVHRKIYPDPDRKKHV